jgi:hypothetical protein
MGDTEKDERLRAAVFAAAEALLARGIRPSLAQIEAEVLGPRPRLAALLEEWVRRLQARAGAGTRGGGAFESTLPARTLPPNYAVRMAEAAMTAEQEASRARDAARRQRDRAELDREIARAEEQLRRLETRHQAEPYNQVILGTIRRIRDRLEIMRVRQKELAGDPGPQAG